MGFNGSRQYNYGWICHCIMHWCKSWKSLLWLGKSTLIEQFRGGKNWSCIWEHTLSCLPLREHNSLQWDCTAVVVYCVIVGPDGANRTSSLFQTRRKVYRNYRWLAASLSFISPAGAFCKCFKWSWQAPRQGGAGWSLRLWTPAGPAHKWMLAWGDTDSAVLYSRNHVQKLSGACHLRSLLQTSLPVGCMHSKPAVLLGYPEEIWSGLLFLVRKKWLPKGHLLEWHQPLMGICACNVLGQGQLEGGRTTAEVEQLWSGAVHREVRDPRDLLAPVNILHACD